MVKPLTNPWILITSGRTTYWVNLNYVVAAGPGGIAGNINHPWIEIASAGNNDGITNISEDSYQAIVDRITGADQGSPGTGIVGNLVGKDEESE